MTKSKKTAKTEEAPTEEPKKAVPPMPPIDKMLGDKTPEVIEWYREYQPEEYAKRYAGRKFEL